MSNKKNKYLKLNFVRIFSFILILIFNFITITWFEGKPVSKTQNQRHSIAISLKQKDNNWNREIMYFILIDRFKDGSKDNNFGVDKNKPLYFHGGDIQGIIDSIDYLYDLGITSIWISPFFKNRTCEFFGRYAYHGYWPWNFFEVDDRFGRLEDLRKLREKLSSKRMKLIMDLVVNHVGYDAPMSKLFPSWFNWNGEIRDWNSKYELENFQIFGLPDFASHKRVVQLFFRSVIRYWMQEIKPDGFRLDAVKHVPSEFWRELNSWVINEYGENILLLGEMLHGDPNVLSETAKEGKFNSLFDFPLYYTLKEVFAEDGDCRKLGVRFYEDHLYKHYIDTKMLATFIDNHDLDRFLSSCNGDFRKLKVALGMIFLCRGFPVIMYGTESGMDGKHDKFSSNRRDMEFYKSIEIFNWIKKLAEIRKANNVLSDGIQVHESMANKYYSFLRILPNSIALIIVNNSDKAEKINFVSKNLDFKEEVVIDLLNNIEAKIIGNNFEIDMPPKTICLFIDNRKSSKKELLYKKYLNLYHKSGNEWLVPVEISLEIRDKNASILANEFRPKVIGSYEEIGKWNVNSEKLVEMYKVGETLYKSVLFLPAYSIGEIKFIIKKKNEGKEEIIWFPRENIIVDVKDTLPEKIHAVW